MRLVYTPEAVEDLLRLRAFIFKWSPATAGRMAKQLVKRIRPIRQFPEMGTRVEESPDPEAVRDAIFGKYIVRYVVHSDAVAILRIWHHLEDREEPANDQG
ncbi:MAG: type II toxin-antitoxin system RelE/ParE family toxin [Pseudomarimonas sp.]